MFDNFFDVYLADTPAGKEEHFKVRFKVYCDEMGFEDKSAFTSEQETDHWDENSVHFLVRHRETGQWIGAMRMVFQQNGALPLNEFSDISLNSSESKNIELSRLCLINDFRKRKTDEKSPLSLNTTSDSSGKDKNVTELFSRRNINRSLIWGLLRAASVYSAEHKIDKWYALNTKALARVISREGFKMNQVGDVCHHRGERYPFMMELDEFYSNSIWSEDYKTGYKLFSELEQHDEFKLDTAEAA